MRALTRAGRWNMQTSNMISNMAKEDRCMRNTAIEIKSNVYVVTRHDVALDLKPVNMVIKKLLGLR